MLKGGVLWRRKKGALLYLRGMGVCFLGGLVKFAKIVRFIVISVGCSKNNVYLCAYSSPVLGGTDERSKSRVKLACTMPCKEEEDEVSPRRGRGYVSSLYR